MLLVGLTGGISCGKSTVAAELKRSGYQIIDFDQLSREVNVPGTLCFKSLVSTFGTEIVDESGQIDRTKLGEIVFADKAKLKQLNGITHKHIAISFLKKLLWHFFTGTRILVLDAPLLIESGLHHLCHFNVLVSVSKDIQLQRLMKRDGFSEEEGRQRMSAQMKTKYKKRYADYVLDNSGTLQELLPKIAALRGLIEKKRSWISPYYLFAFVAAIGLYFLYFKK